MKRIQTAQAEADATEKVEAGKAKLTGLTFMPETAEATFFVGDTQFIVGGGKLMRQPFDPTSSADSFDFSLDGIKSESGARRRLQKFFQEHPEVLRGGIPQHA